MKAYYSIVSISTNPALNEKFNVGLLCVTPTGTYFHFSQAKFKIIAKLLGANAAKLALSALQGMDARVNAVKDDTSFLFENDGLSQVAEPYINYLHRYNNNLIQFTETRPIDVEVNKSVFELLFKKYIFEQEVFDIIEKPKVNTFTKIRNSFKRKASSYANVNFDVDQSVISDLLVPVTVDVFGKNGAYVTGQTFDFVKNADKLQSEITSYLYLIEHTEKADKNSTCFVLGDEPSKKEKQNHLFWSSLRSSKIVEMVPLDESDRIIDFMKQKGVEPIVE